MKRQHGCEKKQHLPPLPMSWSTRGTVVGGATIIIRSYGGSQPTPPNCLVPAPVQSGFD